MKIDTIFLKRCINSLEEALNGLSMHQNKDDLMKGVFCEACVKKFELVLEQSGKLLRKRLALFFASNQQADELAFNDLFRHAAKHRLIEVNVGERWIAYRGIRNESKFNYGEEIDSNTFNIMQDFIKDAKSLASMLEITDNE